MAGMTPEEQKKYDDARDAQKTWASEKEALKNKKKSDGISTLTTAATIAFSADKMPDHQYVSSLVKLAYTGFSYLHDAFKLATYPAPPSKDVAGPVLRAEAMKPDTSIKTSTREFV